LGLKAKTQDRSGMWFELTLGDAVLALHYVDSLPEQKNQRMMLTFVSNEPLEALVTRLQQQHIKPEGIVDEAFGRSFRVYDPDGLLIQINEHEEELYT
jgi:hypothetical protein